MLIPLSPILLLSALLSPAPQPSWAVFLVGEAAPTLPFSGSAVFELQVAPSQSFQSSLWFIKGWPLPLSLCPGRKPPGDKWRAHSDGEFGALHSG